jgi:SPX domain protein involved in polyphosphate accumulation
MQRIENKYLFPFSRINDFRDDIMPHMVYDYYSENRSNKEYTVRSIYLDSPRLNSYYEKLSGVKVRNKFRIRAYNEFTNDTSVFVEIKRKDGNYVSKDRVLVSYSDLDAFLLNKDTAKIKNHSIEYEKRLNSARNFFFYLDRDKLKPVINIVYEREAFECRHGSGLRITFDMNIRSFLTDELERLFDEADMEVLYKDYFVLEVKYYKVLPSWVPNIINKYNLSREAVSKYAFSIDQYLNDKIFLHNI